MKLFRLIVHQKTFSEEDLLINLKDYQDAKEGSIVEIYHPSEEDNPRLLLQIKSIKEDLQAKGLGKDTISVEQSIASSFGLRTYKDVVVDLVDPANVALDSIELTFKDQYMGRSEMWRLKNSLTNTCVYMNKKIEFCGGAVRCQVYEMWSLGDRVACGVITDDTKVVFRSSTSMVYLFLQMSSEMWDFDIHGDLYFEKAVNGFLADLFMKWKKNGSNHEVTIVLFSRTFYEAGSLDEFPSYMKECLQKDYKGRYYEDFYRVAVQNERYDDWSGILVQLRRVFSEYLKLVLEYHSRPDISIPSATNSTAAQGNFLEVLNMSLNVFEKHYLDRSFDRTGQLSVVVTPGVGVFEVDRELTNITKQRIIDNGVGSDLVCVGEQPLHAVPLLKFHNKDTHLNVPDDYSMPHWINLSFYSTNKKVAYSNFVPRIKIPPHIEYNKEKDFPKSKLMDEEEYIHNSFFDYDAYDAQVFQLPPVHPVHDNNGYRSASRYKRTCGTLLDAADLKGQRRKMSDPDIQHTVTVNTQKSQPITIPPAAVSPVVSPHNEEKPWNTTMDREVSPPLRMVVGSEGSPPLESRALINPFDPSHVTIKLTSNRRRWTHIFPKGPTGVLIQQHHYQAVPTQTEQLSYEFSKDSPTPEGRGSNASMTQQLLSRSISNSALQEYCKKRPSGHNSSHPSHVPSKYPSKSITFLWGATGEQEWTPALTTGVDWKSLTIPACLPITTDYFPDKRALQIDYVISLYNLLPDDANTDFSQVRAIYKKPLTTIEVFKELISQRLAQGFQLILLPNAQEKDLGVRTGSLVRKRTAEPEPSETYLLSIGRLFHKISLTGNSITVTRYRPRHPYPGFNYQYRYRFHAPHHDTYEESYASFTTEKLEHYNWNYLDHYICTRGDTDVVVYDGFKYWRFRVYMLPLNNAATKRIIEGAPHCDIYTLASPTDHQQNVDGFLKFIETVVNKFKRPGVSKKPRMSLSVTSQHVPLIQPRRNSMSAVMTLQNAMQNSPFRERLGSNRYPDRPRPRSGSKVMERGRVSPAVELPGNNDNQSQDNSEDSGSQEQLLKSSSTHTEILEAMKQSITGVGFLTTQSLPTATFVSADAASWLSMNMEGVTTLDRAVQILTAMQREHLICHASGDFSKKFLYGFYLYHIVNVDKDDKDYCQPLGDLQSFENEWVEVEVRPPLNWGINLPTIIPGVPTANPDREKGVPHFLCENIDTDYLQGDLDIETPLYRRTHLEIDVSNKSDRIEWGHSRYQTVFRPDQAFELVVEWLTASGSIVAELLFGWARKAQQSCGLQMVPIPHDPLALPYSNKSDPLRGPIFIPLNIESIERRERLFKEFRPETFSDRLFLFQEAIVARFGFIPCLMEVKDTVETQEHQYIHCTGTVFILVTGPAPKPRHRLMSIGQQRPTKRYSIHADVVPSPHEAYITRHVSGKNKDDYDNSRRTGFLWSWNHMVSRRWRTNQGVDNNFQTKILRDFREFCANRDDRLKRYWEESWEAKEAACSLLQKAMNATANASAIA